MGEGGGSAAWATTATRSVAVSGVFRRARAGEARGGRGLKEIPRVCACVCVYVHVRPPARAGVAVPADFAGLVGSRWTLDRPASRICTPWWHVRGCGTSKGAF